MTFPTDRTAANSRDNKLLKWSGGEILHAKTTFELKFRKGEKIQDNRNWTTIGNLIWFLSSEYAFIHYIIKTHWKIFSRLLIVFWVILPLNIWKSALQLEPGMQIKSPSRRLCKWGWFTKWRSRLILMLLSELCPQSFLVTRDFSGVNSECIWTCAVR